MGVLQHNCAGAAMIAEVVQVRFALRISWFPVSTELTGNRMYRNSMWPLAASDFFFFKERNEQNKINE